MSLSRFFVPVLAATTLIARPAMGCAVPFEGSTQHRHSAPPAAASGKNVRLLANVAKTDAAGEGPNFQSDLAFWGNRAFAGNYDGFKIIDIADRDHPKVLANVGCRGPQNDVSVWDDLLILSVDEPRTSPNCDSLAAMPPTDPQAWEGIRIFSIKAILAATPDADGIVRSVNPIAAVATDCGSHTHTLLPDLKNNRLLVYISSYALRSGPRCGPENAAAFGYDPLHRKISIVEIPLRAPERAQVIATPRVDVPVFDLADFGLSGFHPTIACHDIQVFPERGLAAAACASAGQLWDISDPAHPKTTEPLWTVDNPDVQFYHSAAFTWDGKITMFGDEVIAGADTSCQAPSDMKGRLWFYATQSGAEQGSFMIPRLQPDQYCTVHLFNVMRTKKGYFLTSSWYRGGTSLIDFTNPENAREIGYYDPGPMPLPEPDADEGAWSSYWYNGTIYSNNFNRGVDIFGVRDRAVSDVQEVDFENPQTQLFLRRRHDDHDKQHDGDKRHDDGAQDTVE